MDGNRRPICYDLFCGLGGWSEAFLAEGYECVGFDIETHEYCVPENRDPDGNKGTKPVEKRGWTQGCAISLGLESSGKRPATKVLKYPGKLILRDVRSIHGSELKDAAVIVASPPCQEFSYMAMPWSRAKQIQRAILGSDVFPEGYKGSRTIAELTSLFNECFRIQQEAIEAAGHYIPMVVENVRGAQKWVGRAAWNYGSFYLWGDVPALMPITLRRETLKRGIAHRPNGETNFHGSEALRTAKQTGEFSWNRDESFQSLRRNDSQKVPVYSDPRRNGGKGAHLTSASENLDRLGGSGRSFQTASANEAGVKQRDMDGYERSHPNALGWKAPRTSSKSPARKAASAMIAKIPQALAIHIAQTYKPQQ